MSANPCRVGSRQWARVICRYHTSHLSQGTWASAGLGNYREDQESIPHPSPMNHEGHLYIWLYLQTPLGWVLLGISLAIHFTWLHCIYSLMKKVAYWKMKLSPRVLFCEVRKVKGFDRKRIAAVMLGITSVELSAGVVSGNNVFPINGQWAICCH